MENLTSSQPNAKLDEIQVEIQNVCKRQRVEISLCEQTLENLIEKIEDTKAAMREGRITVASGIYELQEKLKMSQDIVSAEAKVFSTELNVVIKNIEASFQQMELFPLDTEWDPDPSLCEQIIASHLVRKEAPEIVESFQKESSVCNNIVSTNSLKQNYEEILLVCESLNRKDVQSALKWCRDCKITNNSALQKQLTELQFRLHKLQVILLLEKGERMQAMEYMRHHMAEFFHLNVTDYFQEMKKLACCLLWAGKLASSPYAHLLEDSQWSAISTNFMEFACSVRGFPKDSLLSVCICAGYVAYPTISKLATLRKKLPGAGSQCEMQMPYFGPQLQFHSSFSCPILQQVSTPTNPPVLLPCHHVLSQSALNSLVKTGGKLKCPYCPTECSYDRCLTLHI